MQLSHELLLLELPGPELELLGAELRLELGIYGPLDAELAKLLELLLTLCPCPCEELLLDDELLKDELLLDEELSPGGPK